MPGKFLSALYVAQNPTVHINRIITLIGNFHKFIRLISPACAVIGNIGNGYPSFRTGPALAATARGSRGRSGEGSFFLAFIFCRREISILGGKGWVFVNGPRA